MNKLQLLWIDIKAKFEVIYIPNFQNFLYFQQLAFKNLFGKMTIVDSRKVKSNGGFKYYQMEISKLPFSKTHNYS